jgi:integrase
MGRSDAVWTTADHELAPDVTERIRHARTRNTQATYEPRRRTYAAWCARSGRRALPGTIATLVSYVHHLTQQSLAPASIRVHICAVTSWHEEAQLPRPDPRQANLLLRAYEHQRAREGYRPRQVDPVTVEHLRTLLDACEVRSAAGMRDRAMLLLGFALMARRSILGRIELADLRLRPGGMVVHVRHDKRQPAGRTVVVPALPPGDPLCVVTAVQAWVAHLAAMGATSGPLLRAVRADGRVPEHPLSGESIARIFRRCVARAGLDGVDLTPHSMRAGGASEAYDGGADPLDIARHGGWADGSTVLWRYIRGRDAWVNSPVLRALTGRPTHHEGCEQQQQPRR